MTEHRSPYHALSGTTETRATACDPLASPLTQYHTDGSSSRDTILLLPILHSPQRADSPEVCLHLIHLPNGSLGLCNTLTEQRCPCCGNAMCVQHQSSRSVAFPDESGVWHEEHTALLCETCVCLSKEAIYALRAFRLMVNQQGGGPLNSATGIPEECSTPQWKEAMLCRIAHEKDLGLPISTISNQESRSYGSDPITLKAFHPQSGIIEYSSLIQRYAVINGHTFAAQLNLFEDQVEQALANLGIANSRWW